MAFGQPEGPAALSKPPLPQNDAEANILTVIDEMTRDRSQRHLSVSPEDGRLMRQLTEAIGTKRVVEVGTSTGYSGLWFSLALRSTGGKLLTHELDPGRARQARENFKKAGTVIEGDAQETVKQPKDEPAFLLNVRLWRKLPLRDEIQEIQRCYYSSGESSP